ncbi:3-oxoacyl-ACP reductase FabG [Solwaraspora sp. WMMD406]|uniref:3-oxoacyl-ACP reductase family protein n=1 Tax=Solwaraspora sp. WMMD406 TaxID=3016095 RepID=UPI002417538F|nr:3-oxoacyl-ACP reductase family protein [Solwaraspora sp. WMMD406]MDG4762670.1 3-oxoacyl-ACP reductase FabG [Solwaraspora sp. WMMD406]
MTAPAGARPLSAQRPEKPVALVTGASGGFGAAVAVELDRLGCRVALHYNRAADGAREVSERLGNDSVVVQADVSDWDSVNALHHQVVESLGEVDILVNNAAVRKDSLLMSQSPEVWGEVIQTNLMGTFHMCRAALPSMIKRRWGRIINVVSPSALVATPGQTAYAASKSGVIALTRTLATECGRRGVTVNAISPGFMETRMTASATEKFRQNLAANLPVPRLTTPEEVAPAIGVFLDNGYLTGQVLSVDGGISLT